MNMAISTSKSDVQMKAFQKNTFYVSYLITDTFTDMVLLMFSSCYNRPEAIS